jgi:hypothetical protein
MRAKTRSLGLGIWLFSVGCVTLPKGDVDALKPSVESFHHRARWKDFRAASQLVVESRRAEFLKARLVSNDEKDLFITDFQLEDATMSPDTLSATAISRISWYRLPSSTEISKVVTSKFVWAEQQWMLESQDDGPFEELKPVAKTAPKAAKTK